MNPKEFRLGHRRGIVLHASPALLPNRSGRRGPGTDSARGVKCQPGENARGLRLPKEAVHCYRIDDPGELDGINGTGGKSKKQ